LEARGEVAAAGGDGDDGRRPKRLVPSFSPLGCLQKWSGGFLEPATDALGLDPRPDE
jgi:hypothetical protein